MKNLGRLILVAGIAVLSALTVQCSKNRTSTGPIATEGVHGSWNWVKSYGGFAGWTLTPNSVGYIQKLVFRTYGIFEAYRNDTLTAAGEYVVSREKLPYEPDSVNVIRYPYALGGEQIYTITADTLFLQDLCDDCYEHTYVRMK